MPLLRKKKLRCLAIIVIIGALLALLVSRAGLYLEYAQPPQCADAIVVLMGSTGDRSMHAYELFDAGWSQYVLLSETYTEARDLFQKRGIHVPASADITHYLLTELGVPDSLITIIPGNARSTFQEARMLKQWLRQQHTTDTLLLVTSSYHSRRAAITYRHVLGRLDKPPVLLSTPTPYSDFQAQRWWRCRESAKRVVMEYSRLLYFWAWERWFGGGPQDVTYVAYVAYVADTE